MNIIFINPNKAKILRTIAALERIKISEIIILGNSSIIDSIKREEGISLTTKVIEVNSEDVVYKTKEYQNCFYVFNDETLIKKIINTDAINHFYVADISDFIFISSYSQKRYLDFEDKRKSIANVFDFMNHLGIKKSNVSLITNNLNKSELLEANLIRMILKEKLNVNILNPARLSEVFDPTNSVNVFNKNINMLIFKNYEITKTFIETLQIFRNYRIASICNYKDLMYVDASSILSESDLLFSILLVNKYLNEKKEKVKFQKINTI